MEHAKAEIHHLPVRGRDGALRLVQLEYRPRPMSARAASRWLERIGLLMAGAILGVLLFAATGCAEPKPTEPPKLPDGMDCGPKGTYSLGRCVDQKYGVACYYDGLGNWSCASVCP